MKTNEENTTKKQICIGCLRRKPSESFNKKIRIRCNICKQCRRKIWKEYNKEKEKEKEGRKW